MKDALNRDDIRDRRNNAPPHRDVRDNPPYMRPLVDERTGEAKLPPGGRRIETLAVGGPSFKIDGYGVEWDVGIKWRFSIGFEEPAGLTLFNVRVVMPPTEKYPDGELIPYLYKVNIPNFGTAYAASALGNLFSANFLESHFYAALGLVPGSNCRGPHATFPIFRAKGMKAVAPENKSRPIFYSTYGLDKFVEDEWSRDIAQLHKLPLQALALDGQTVSQGIIPHLFCLSESVADHSMWHLYTAQRERKLTIVQPTISDAYNIALTYEFFSTGKMNVAERLHGKPAVVNMGLPHFGGSFGQKGKGGYASNHVHWHSVYMEPHVKKNRKNVRNALVVEDLMMHDDETNAYGLAFNRVGREVKRSDSVQDLKFDYAKNRYWRLAAFDEQGNDLGGLTFKSGAWGPLMVPWNQDPLQWKSKTNFSIHQSFANHWWLHNQDVYVQNAADTKNRQILLSRADQGDYSCWVGKERRCLPDEEIGDSPAVHAIMKMFHAVITDELPVQDGFTNVQMEIWPHNLFDYNPNVLVRYMPGYADTFQNNYFHTGEKIYQNPYTSEWADL